MGHTFSLCRYARRHSIEICAGRLLKLIWSLEGDTVEHGNSEDSAGSSDPVWEHVPFDDALLADLNWIDGPDFGYSADLCSPALEVIASKVDLPAVAAAVPIDKFLARAQLEAFNFPEIEPNINKAENINPSPFKAAGNSAAPCGFFSASARERRHLIRRAARGGVVRLVPIVLMLGSALALSP